MQPTRSLLAASHAVGEQILARPGTRIESLVGRGHLILIVLSPVSPANRYHSDTPLPQEQYHYQPNDGRNAWSEADIAFLALRECESGGQLSVYHLISALPEPVSPAPPYPPALSHTTHHNTPFTLHLDHRAR